MIFSRSTCSTSQPPREVWTTKNGTSAICRPPFVIVHYTPLYYWVTGLVQRVGEFGSMFLAGRLVSTLSTFATAIVAGAIAFRLTRRAWTALAAGCLWLSFLFVAFWGTSQRVDGLAVGEVDLAEVANRDESGQ